MGDCESVAPQLEGEENLIAAAKHIVRALGSNKNLTKDVKKILADLGSQLSTMATIDDEGPDEAFEYLSAVDEARKLIQGLENRCLNGEDEKELLRRAHDVLQLAMQRLEEEFKYLLVQHRQPFEPEHMSFRSSEDDGVDVGSMVSFGDESFEESARRDSVSRTSEECIIDLVHPDVIQDLKCIANSMFMSNYDHECRQAYVIVRKDALDECLFDLEIEKFSIEDVLKMEWGTLNSKIKRWVRAMKVFVRRYLGSEKWLCDQIFSELGSANFVCFVEAAKAPMLQLLNFAEAISIGPHQPEKLVRFLDMYEVLADLLLDIDALFPDEAGSSVKVEYHEVLKRLADSVRATLVEFKNAVATNTSTNPFAGGGIHHLTRYVMNYLRLLVDYKDTLNLLLKNDGSVPVLLSPDSSPSTEDESTSNDFSGGVSAMTLHLQSLTSILEVNLHEKSKLYRDASLQHFFLMNNIHYMAQKVKNSELRVIFGDKWIRKHNWKFQQHAMDYERATWSTILSFLKDESNSSNSSISRTLLKERLRSFYVAFEEVYRTQTAWLIPDVQLREDLRISTSLKVIQAYRTFVGRQMYHIGEKHIRYNAEEMQDYLLDLFEGSQKSLHSPHRR
ncbi:hypothetical protein CXB51_024004 [Gossypium anomalum]|uniref:Exocyst subunit Exo70 family protein n=1 Tax=Gossypium anomalum TaxID=47600 RepID=A0A8J5YU11_9ROSI|nr:hypothetical protein CXB51_024004 [Gossypium anomalum]